MDLLVVVAHVHATPRPFEPVLLRLGEGDLGSIASGSGSCEGNHVSTNGMRSPAASDELRHRRHLLPMDLDGGSQAEAVRAGDRDARVIDPTHPRHDLPVVEADHELRAHLTSPSSPSRIRTMSGALPRGGMNSIARTLPSSVS